jgi:hypothetical protein
MTEDAFRPHERTEAAQARAEFQRDVFKVRDARIATADAVGTTVTATAAAVATVAAAVLSDFDANAWWIVLVLAVALLTVLMSLLSRAEKPWPRPSDLNQRLSDAKNAVDAMHRADPCAGPEAMHRLAFDAWWALTYSAEGREKVKRRINLLAVLGLVTQVALAAVAMFVTAR